MANVRYVVCHQKFGSSYVRALRDKESGQWAFTSKEEAEEVVSKREGEFGDKRELRVMEESQYDRVVHACFGNMDKSSSIEKL